MRWQSYSLRSLTSPSHHSRRLPHQPAPTRSRPPRQSASAAAAMAFEKIKVANPIVEMDGQIPLPLPLPGRSISAVPLPI
uniref:Uncharacterized protein n=1 Tax=Aegilops tauschii subsp. strangulata TaxID=200361 RepID=A0A453F599_AEGTS